jgi:hypothetical protein
MHRISSRQDAVLEEVHEMTMRIERLSQSEHDLISDVHPQVSEIKEQAKTLEKLFRPKRANRVSNSSH